MHNLQDTKWNWRWSLAPKEAATVAEFLTNGGKVHFHIEGMNPAWLVIKRANTAFAIRLQSDPLSTTSDDPHKLDKGARIDER